MSLVEEAARRCDRVVASVFVNPTQFGPGEDLATYPGTLPGTGPCWKTTAAIWSFTPRWREMYPCRGSHLCRGLFRRCQSSCAENPTHPFPGGVHGGGQALQHRHPGQSLFGWKDAQQLLILRRMVRDLGYGGGTGGLPHCPGAGRPGQVFPEYLLNAPGAAGSPGAVPGGVPGTKAGGGRGTRRGPAGAGHEGLPPGPALARIDYVQAVDSETLEPVHTLRGTVLVALAVYLGKTRLIDNFIAEGL